MTDESTETTTRPQGRLQPTEGASSEIYELLTERRYDEALERVETEEPESPLERDWFGYLRGGALLGARELDDAYEAFRSTAERITRASKDELGPERHRVAAKCLKKMGWYHRRGDGHARAYAYHSMEYDLLDEHGSPIELHDAALSLDVVAYHLRTPRISRNWIRRSIEAARAIDGEVDRLKALGISWNNLVGTLCDLGDFEEAGDAAEQSLEQWSAYEELAGEAENRVVWAKHIYGDAYKRWGDALIGEGDVEEGLAKLERARDVLEEAVGEAEEREMEDDDRADIEGKLEDVESSIEAAGGSPDTGDGADEDEVGDDDSGETADDSDGDDGSEDGDDASGSTDDASGEEGDRPEEEDAADENGDADSASESSTSEAEGDASEPPGDSDESEADEDESDGDDGAPSDDADDERSDEESSTT